MAYQPKSYRKFLAGSVSAAVVASALAAPAGAAAAAASFPDVPTGHWAYNEITTLADKGIINGYSDGSFRPSELLNRGQAAALFTNALGLDVPENLNVFTDLKATSYFAQYAAAVEANGVFGGYADGSFGAGDNLTREQMASVLVRAFDFKDTGAAVDLTDLDAAHASHRENIKILTQNGISVNADKTFDPKEPVSRAHFATFLYRSMLATGMLNENPDVVSVTAINATTVEVKMAGEVKDVESIDFTIDGLTVSNAAVKQTDSSVVVLTTSAQEGGKEYTVKGNGETFGKFTGISAVIPTTINFVEYSNQSKVGNEITLKADIGSKTAGVPVTFNVDAPAGSLNKDQLVEVYTNEDGIAEYSYTQYAAGEDVVSVYPTGAPQVRAIGKVYWGVNYILEVTMEDSKDANLANGEEKVYTVTYRDAVTGKPVSGADLNVTLQENVNIDFANKGLVSKATVGDPEDTQPKTPYQAKDGEDSEVIVETDSNGKATFVVSGTNTTATPVVFVDGDSAMNTVGDNDRLDSTEIQVVAPTVSFKGAQETNKITVEAAGTKEAAIVDDEENGRLYTVTVTDKDGKAYAGGVVNVTLDELIDNVRGTDTDAYFVDADDYFVGGSADGDTQVQLKLDKDGKGEFYLVSASDDDVATPVVWIDQNDAQNNQTGELEEGEPFKLAESTNFQDPRVVAGQLSIVDAGGRDEDSFAGTATAFVEFSPVNQSGNADFTGNIENTVPYDSTYTVVNTGTEAITVNVGVGSWTDGTGADADNRSIVIQVGGKLVLHNNDAVGTDGFSVDSNGEGGAFSVKATAVTEDNWSDDNRENNLRINGGETLTATFANADGIPSFLRNAVVEWADIDDEELKFVGRDFVLDYSEATFYVPGKSYAVSKAEFETLLTSNDTVDFTKGTDGKHKLEIVTDRTGTNNGPVQPDTNTGTIEFTNSTFNASAPQAIELEDADLNVDATVAEDVNVTVSDSVGNSLVVTLSETGNDTGEFTGNVTAGQLATLTDGTLTVTYVDAANESGNVQRITATATLNTVAGVLSVANAGAPTVAYSAGTPTSATTTIATPTVTADGVLTITVDGTTSVDVALDDATHTTVALIAEAINDESVDAGLGEIAEVVSGDIVLTSPTTGTTSDIAYEADSTLTGTSLTGADVDATNGTAGTPTAAKWAFTVATVPAAGETVTVQLGEESVELVSGTDFSTVATLASELDTELEDYTVTTSGNVIVIEQDTAAATTANLSVSVSK
jgi:trimeric autotransporter adhesin